MKRVIYKYRIGGQGYIVELPTDAIILSCQMQRDMLCIWVQTDPLVTTKEKVEFVVVGTGTEFESKGLIHLTTVQSGPFVWHVFKRT